MKMRVSALALIAAIWAVVAINTNLAQKATVSTVQFSQTTYTCEEHSDDVDSSFDMEEELQDALSSKYDRNCSIQLSRSDTGSEVTVMVNVLPNRGSATFDPEIARGNPPLYEARPDIDLLGQRFGDFNPTPQRVTFGPGVSDMTVNFTIYNDACPESAEDFYVQLESMDGSETSDPCMVVIQENDQELRQNGEQYSQSNQKVTLQIPDNTNCEDENFQFQVIFEGNDPNPANQFQSILYPHCSPIYVKVEVFRADANPAGEQSFIVFRSLLPAHHFGLDESFPPDAVSVPAVMDGLFENDEDLHSWRILTVPSDVRTTNTSTLTGDIDDIIVTITPESQEVDNPKDQIQFTVELVNVTSQLEPNLLVTVTLGVQCMDGLPDDCVTLSPSELTFDQTSESSFRHHVTATPKDSLVLDSDKRFIVHVMSVTVNGQTKSVDHTKTSVTFETPMIRCENSVLFNSATVTIKKFLLCVGWSVNSSSLTVLENEGPARLTLQLQSEDGSPLESQPYNVTVMVTTWEITGASDAAEAPEDYTPQQFEVTIPAGELSVEVVIPITDDIFPEGLERFQVTFNVIDEQDEFIQMCGANTTTVTIVDNDPHCVDWSPDSLDQTLVESEGPATLTIRLSITDGTQPEPLDYPLDLQIIYIPITAEAPEDYTPQQFEVTIPAGELSVEVVIPIVDDVVPEGRERFQVMFNFTVEEDQLVEICSGNTATVNIDDDDDPRCIVWSSDSLSQTLVESEGPAILTLQLQSTDGTQPEPLDYPLDLQVRYIPITAEAPEDYTPQQFEVTIPAGELSVEVVIPIVDDIVPEGRERFQVTFNFTDEQDDTVQICSGNTATVNIDDDDDPRCIVWSSDSLSQTLVESEGPATLTLQLQNTDGTQPEPLDYPLDLQVRYIPITAEAPEDYTPQQFEVTIPVGELSVEVVIPIVDDIVPEGPENFLVMFNFTDEQDDTVQICSGNTATVNIDDDDDPRCIVWSSDSLSQTLVESEGPATLTLQLQNTDGTQPEPLDYPLDLQVRYIPITAEAPEDYTPQQFEVTIPTGELSVEVVIPIVNDVVPEGRERFQVIFNLADEEDQLVEICGTSTATVNIDDDDNVCVVWQRTTPLIVMEDAGTATLEIQLQDRVGNAIQLPYPVVLEITTTGDSATAPSDFEGHSQEVTIREGEQRVMVEIPIVNDASLEEEEVFSVTVTIIRVPDDVRERIDVCGNSSVIVRIPDDDNVALQLGSTECVDEGDEATLTITKNGEHQEPIVIVVTTIDGTASAGDDFQLLTNEVTLTPEQQQNTIRIKILEDSKFDPNDKFTVKIEVLNTDPRRPRITITEDTVDVEIACKGERQVVLCGVTVDQQTCTTETPTLQCNHNATGNVTFIWRRERLLLDGEVSQTLQTPNVGRYTCGVVLPGGIRVECLPATLGESTLERSFTGPGGSDSCIRFLGNIPTSICSIPDICVAAGDTLTLDCLTVPLSDSTITKPNGDIIPTGRFGPIIADSSVQGTYTCTTPDYVCPVESERCVFVYEPATCSEIQPADLPTETNNVRIASVTPQGVNVRALGDINEVQLYCRFDGIPEPTITWLDPDRQQLSSGAKFSITQSGGISILTIRNYNNDSDTGEYSCSIENGGGSQTCSATLGVCGRCIAGDWSECHPNCIRGKRYRNVSCEGGDECINLPRCERCTHLNRKCDKYPMWKSWPWTACSTTCDSGYKIRKVMCFIDSENTMVDDSLCEGPCSAKPYDYTECNGAKTCCTEDTSSPTYCGLIKQGGLCNNDNYKYKCCKTCDYPFGPPGN